MNCISRVARGKLAFADGTHYFYLEGCCNLPVKDNDGDHICMKCRHKNPTCKDMTMRTFDHGIIGGPIPLKSHIYGSPWYNMAVRLYGEPSEEIVELAIGASKRALVEAPHKDTAHDTVMKNTAIVAKKNRIVSRPIAHVQQQQQETIYAEYVEEEDTLEVGEVIRVKDLATQYIPEKLVKYLQK